MMTTATSSVALTSTIVMCGYRYILIAALCVLISGCAGQQALTSIPAAITPVSLSAIDAAVHRMYNDVLLPLDYGVLYKTTFQLRYIESESVLEPTILHDSSTTTTINYFPNIRGPKQDLYLLELPAKSGHLYYVYFSVWYQTDRSRMRFGPAYLGRYNDLYSNIQFGCDVVTSATDSLLSFRPKKRGRSFVFVIDKKLDDPERPRIEICRIILTEPNKIGGNKQFLYTVQGSKLDQLIFSSADTIKLH